VRVLVAHHLLVRVGGGERVSAVLIDELLRRGHEVAVATTCRADITNLFKRFFERSLPTPVRSYSLFPRFYPIFGIYQRLASFIPVGTAIRSENPDIVFIDHEIYKPLRSVLKGRRLVHYVHFPWNPRLADRNWELYGMTLPEKYRHLPFNIYWKGYIELQRLVSVDENFADVICANSQFTAQVVKTVWDREATVIYPPVSVNDFYFLPPSEKEDIVVHLGRISGEKRIEDVIAKLLLMGIDELFREGFWEGPRKWISSIVNWIREKIGAIVNWISDKFERVKNIIRSPIEKVRGFFGGIRERIPFFQMGGVMPHTGLAYLHKGEIVTPAGASPINFSPTIIVNANVSSSYDVRALADELNRYYASDFERIIQGRGLR